METPFAMARNGGPSEPAHDIVTGDHGGQHVRARRAEPLAGAKQGRDDGATRVRTRSLVNVVDTNAVERDAIDEGGVACRRAFAIQEDGRVPSSATK